MTKVLLTGGSGFIAAHILEQLLERGHKVITTVRSEEKAQKIRDAHPKLGKDDLDVVVVGDIAKPDAFDEVVKIPGIEVVLHTASPFHYKWKDPHELIDPALVGTTSILKGIVKSAPSVRRVVVTSSFASILTEDKMADPNTTYTEASWNPVTIDDIHRSAATAYRASKKLAEEAAWAFVLDPANGAKFDLVTICPPLVFGPVVHHLASLDSINTSNERVVECVTGKWKDSGVAATGLALNWIDVRDCAEAHVKAGLELPEAGGKRLWTTSGPFCNRDIYNIVKKNFPEYVDQLPPEDKKGGEFPPDDQRYKYDNSETEKILGIKWISLEKSIVDTVKSFKDVGS